jgi:hypothetical protein
MHSLPLAAPKRYKYTNEYGRYTKLAEVPIGISAKIPDGTGQMRGIYFVMKFESY